MVVGIMGSAVKNLSMYRETIVVMMRYGGCVDKIARDLGIVESDLVRYIREEGLDDQLSRRGWRWKTEGGLRRKKRSQARGGKWGLRVPPPPPGSDEG
tara:strand:- start:1078 stop:1371 length:294 start_codon:yes stop_codon:yes gene_type:complete